MTGRLRRAGVGGRLRRALVALLVAAFCAVSAGCAGTTSTDHDYRLKVQHTATDLNAVAGSAQLAARQYLEGKLPQAYADYVISRAEQDGSSIQNTFDTRQPPDDASAKLRDQVDQSLQQVTGYLSDLRMAVRSDDHGSMRTTLADLSSALDRLSKFQEES